MKKYDISKDPKPKKDTARRGTITGIAENERKTIKKITRTAPTKGFEKASSNLCRKPSFDFAAFFGLVSFFSRDSGRKSKTNRRFSKVRKTASKTRRRKPVNT